VGEPRVRFGELQQTAGTDFSQLEAGISGSRAWIRHGETFETEVTRRETLARVLAIIEGCDKACTYCVVPYTRGPERAEPSDAICGKSGNSRPGILKFNFRADWLIPMPIRRRGMCFSELLLGPSPTFREFGRVAVTTSIERLQKKTL